MSNIVIIIVLGLIFVGLTLNYIIYKLIVFYARRRFILPFLKTNSMSLTCIRFTGFLNKGDFGNRKLSLDFVPEIGKITTDTYVYVFARTFNGDVERYTIKIVCKFLFIRKVFLKSGNKSEEVALLRH